ncbi:hypothetical protein V1505DRAFT_360998 [Lipomyces doorenjongii]
MCVAVIPHCVRRLMKSDIYPTTRLWCFSHILSCGFFCLHIDLVQWLLGQTPVCYFTILFLERNFIILSFLDGWVGKHCFRFVIAMPEDTGHYPSWHKNHIE